METKLARIAEISKQKPKEMFTSIYHLINKDLLIQCHKELNGKKAKGIDGITKAKYEENLEQHIKDTNIIKLINKFIKAGIIENKRYYGT